MAQKLGLLLAVCLTWSVPRHRKCCNLDKDASSQVAAVERQHLEHKAIVGLCVYSLVGLQ